MTAEFVIVAAVIVFMATSFFKEDKFHEKRKNKHNSTNKLSQL